MKKLLIILMCVGLFGCDETFKEESYKELTIENYEKLLQVGNLSGLFYCPIIICQSPYLYKKFVNVKGFY